MTSATKGELKYSGEAYFKVLQVKPVSRPTPGNVRDFGVTKIGTVVSGDVGPEVTVP
jgi:hypothetical protein